MYLLLGLLAAVLAGSMADAFLTDTDEDDAADAVDESGDAAATGDLISAAFASGHDIHTVPWDYDPLDNHPLANGMPDHDGPDASWRDPALDDGVHSSDALPPDDAPPPSGETGADTPPPPVPEPVPDDGPTAPAHLPWDYDPLDNHPLANGMPEHDGPDASWRDPALDDGVHSSDALPPDDAAPVVQGLHAGNDQLAGGAGTERFILGDWIGPGQVVIIMDFMPGTDRIELTLNPDLHTAPDLSTAPDPADPDHALILMNGEVIARVLGASGLRADDIDVIAEHPEGAHLRSA